MVVVHIIYYGTSEDLRHDLCNERRLRKVSIKHLDAVASLNPKGDFCNGNCRVTEEDIKPNIVSCGRGQFLSVLRTVSCVFRYAFLPVEILSRSWSLEAVTHWLG